MRLRAGVVLGWMVMLAALASNGLTLLSGASVIDRSVTQRAEDLMVGEAGLARAVLRRGDPALSLRDRAAGLEGAISGGRLGFLPLGPDGRIATGALAGFVPAALARRVVRTGRRVFAPVTVDGRPWYILLAPIERNLSDARAGPAPLQGVLLLARPRAPLAAEAETERDALIGTALLTLVLFGYALVGVAQWLGAQMDERETRLSEAKGELELALAHMSDGLCVFDAEDRVRVFNGQLSHILGLPPGALRRGMSYVEVLALTVAAGNYPGRSLEEVIAERVGFARAGTEPKVEHHELGDGRVLEVAYCPTAEGGWLYTCADVTVAQRSQRRIAFMAEHDPLTGLPNRAAFTARLSAGVATATASRPLTLLWLDLDQFKEVNDSWGHPAGDQLLCVVAERLRTAFRDGEDCAYRLGGDEFAVLLSGVEADIGARRARRVLRELNQPCRIDGRTYRPRGSIGIAAAPADATEPDRLMSRADLALYAAKASGRNQVRRFLPDIEHRVAGRASLERELEIALVEGQFTLRYQPILALPTRALVGFEALLRWNHPERGLILPEAFIAVAEQTRLIDEIGAFVLTESCAEAASWVGTPGVSVNLSARQLRQRTLRGDVEGALRRAGLAPGRLELEVTETAIIQDAFAAFAALHEVQALGVRVALDDFGTGYSSLSFLTRFKFDTIKIDLSFIAGMQQRPDCAAIVEAVTSLGARLGLATVAEGIETIEQLRRVGEFGCGRAQGFLLGRPMPAEAARRLAVAAHTRAAASPLLLADVG